MTSSHTPKRHTSARAAVGFLPSTAYAVLGLLSFGAELSGYELRQLALNSLRFFFWSPAQSQIYRELRRLEELGHVRARAVAQADRPDKTVYALTDAGRAELVRWLEEAPVGPPVVKYDSALRVFFGHLTSRERLLEVIDEHRRHLEALLADLDRTRAALGGDPALTFPRIVAAWGERLYGGDLGALDEVAAGLCADEARVPTAESVPEATLEPPPGAAG